MAKYGKQNNEGRGGSGGSGKSKTNNGRTTGPRMSDERRGDVTKTPSHKNPYPRGMC